MRFSVWRPLAIAASLGALVAPAMAELPDENLLKSNSLNTCQDNSNFTASLFTVTFTPGNGSAAINLVAVSSIEGSVVFDVAISAYGYEFIRNRVDPCTTDLRGLCPMTAGKIPMKFNLDVPPAAVKQIPSIAYSVPDLDAKVRVYLNRTDTKEAVACVEASISNGKTVDLVGVKWATAIIAGLALMASAVVSGLGHSNAAAHVASNALSLFGYFQAQAIVGLTGIHLPPIVQAWTQDFQWTMGIIRVGFMQNIFTWYQRATGGTPATVFSSLQVVSVQIEKRKRAIDTAVDLYRRSAAMMPRAAVGMANTLMKRDTQTDTTKNIKVSGIQRVAFRALIESTNLFMTGLTFFCIFVLFTILGVAAFKGFCELAVKRKWMKSDKFLEFRNGWFTVLKGILFRMTLIGFPQMTILCLWEFTQKDSPAEVVLAVFFFFGMAATLGWAASKVIRIARRSVSMHRNPAYILFSDPKALNKWGFLYVQFRAGAYYFIVPVLAYTLVKGMVVALAQGAPVAQAIAFLLIEAGALIAASVMRPWMDKSTNSFNIAICVLNFLNSIFLLIFSNVFNQPGIITGVIGVVFFVANAAFSLILLIMIIVSTTLVLIRKNPDTRYQVMGDDRTSFMKSQTQLNTTTELDALAATARGDKAGGFNKGLDLDDDNESISSQSMRRRVDPAGMPLPPSTANSGHGAYQPPGSPADPSVPLFPGDNRRGTPGFDNGSGPFRGPGGRPMGDRAPSPFGNQSSGVNFRQQHNASPAGYRSQHNASPWQRGAGYD